MLCWAMLNWAILELGKNVKRLAGASREIGHRDRNIDRLFGGDQAIGRDFNA